MRILFVAPYIPSPVRVRPYQWIRTLAKLGHHVRLIALQPPEDRWVKEPPVADCCETVEVFPLSRARTLRNAAAALPGHLPLQAAYSHHPEAERRIAAEAARCDIVHVEHLRGALLAQRIEGVPCVIDAVDSISRLFAQAATQAPSWRQRLIARLDLERTKWFEARFPARFDRTLVSSNRDADAFRQLARTAVVDGIVMLPNGVDLEYFHPASSRASSETVLFTGKMGYHANEAAALDLAERIMPLVWHRHPNARLVIAGKDPSPAIQLLTRDPRIEVTGFLEDLRPHFWSAAVVAAPLVYGTGIQNKVLEAMACGVPVVASSTACEGIGASSGEALLVGSTPQEMADHTVTLLGDAALRARLGAAGRRFVERHHDWSIIGRHLVEVYDDARAAYRRCA